MFEGKIVALRSVEVVSTDYALQEYGLRPGEMAAVERRIGAGIKTARKRGELTPFTGSESDFHLEMPGAPLSRVRDTPRTGVAPRSTKARPIVLLPSAGIALG